MTPIRYRIKNQDRPTTAVSFGSGQTFDAWAAKDKLFTFIVDDASQSALISALDADPRFERAGGAGSTGGGLYSSITSDGVSVGTYGGAVGDGVFLYNATMTAGSAVLVDAGAAFTDADVHKTILVSGVGPGNESLVTTIASRQSATQVTLAAPATVNSPDPANCKIAVYGTDDTAAIQAASDAAAQTAEGILNFDAKVYIIAGALQQGGQRKSNAQVTLPNGGVQSLGRLTWRGARSSAATPLMPFPNARGGTTIVSTLLGRSYSSTYGIPSVVGGPTQEQQSTFSGWLFEVEDVTLLAPRNPSLSGFNLEGVSSANQRRIAVGTLEWGYWVNTFEALAIAEPTHPQAAAMITPVTTNQQGGAGVTEEFSTWGYFAGLVPNEHTVGNATRIFATKIPIAVRNGAGTVHSGATHITRLDYVSVENCPYAISGWDPAAASSASGVQPIPTGKFTLEAALDIEDYSDAQIVPPWVVLVNHVNDPNGRLRGTVKFARWSYVLGAFTEQTALVKNSGSQVSYRSLLSPVVVPGVNSIDQPVIDALLPWLIQILPAHDDQAIVQGGWVIANAGVTASMFNAMLVNSGTHANGDEIAFDVVLAKGTWNIDLLYTKSTAFGIVRAKLDNVNINPTTDGYNASTAYNQKGSWPGQVIATTGKHRLSFAVEGKNASSTDFYMQIQAVQLRRTA